MSRLAESVVLVTGASSGIGLATATAFAREGARVAIAARRADRIAEIKSALTEAYGVEVFARQMDVRDVEQAESTVRAVHDYFGRFDILVNNAGLARGLRPVEEGDEGEWREMMETNVMGLLWVTRAAIPLMRNQGSGHIINLGSIAGHEVYAKGSVYCASKFAVKAITRALRLELVGSNIRITSVDPGMVETEFSSVRFGGDEERAKSVYEGVQPLSGDDVAECILFAANRPPHVNIDEILVKPTAQASATVVFREK
jgi:3-hydroxy acid dehydrogenase / malonic semialdehyde reductase